MSLYKELSRCPDSILLLVDWTQNADVLFKKMINVSFIETKQKCHCLKEECNHSIKKSTRCSRQGSICFLLQARPGQCTRSGDYAMNENLFLLQKSREKFNASALGSRYVLLVGEGQLTGPASLVTSVAGLTAVFPGESFVEGRQSQLKRRFPITGVK